MCSLVMSNKCVDPLCDHVFCTRCTVEEADGVGEVRGGKKRKAGQEGWIS